jgi:NodT family efflux transporter outer membrane factor (OMF) lipoprotein
MRMPSSTPPLVLATALALSACAVGPDFKRPAPDLPPAWSATAQADAAKTGATTAPPTAEAWWTGFHDPELASLVDRAFSANLDLREAFARIAEARASRDVAAAGRWPQLTGNFGLTTNRLSDTTATGAVFTSIGKFNIPGFPSVAFPNPYPQYQLGFDASWEADLFGRVRRSIEAARADAQASAEAAQDVKLSVAAEVAQTYFDLRAAQLRRQITAQSIAAARDLLDLARQRRAAGLSSEVDVSNAGAQAASEEAELPLLDRQITQDVNALSRLIDREPDALRAELDKAEPLPAAPPQIPLGLPADLARRRPDVREAEARLHAATARVGVATAQLFPNLTISGPAGLQSRSISTLADWASRFYTFGPTLQVPVFEGGRLRAGVRLQDAEAKEAALAYRSAVLSAMHDVEGALAAYAADGDRRRALEETVARNRDARDLARQRYASGLGSFIDVLDAERTLLQNQLAETQASQAAAIDLVALYKALGGGWDEADAAAKS